MTRISVYNALLRNKVVMTILFHFQIFYYYCVTNSIRSASAINPVDAKITDDFCELKLHITRLLLINILNEESNGT